MTKDDDQLLILGFQALMKHYSSIMEFISFALFRNQILFKRIIFGLADLVYCVYNTWADTFFVPGTNIYLQMICIIKEDKSHVLIALM